MDRLDARRDGFVHLRAGAHARADRAVTTFGLRRDDVERRARGIDPVCPLPGGLGAVLHLGPHCRPVWPDQGPGRDHLHVRHLHRAFGRGAKRLGVSHFPFHRGRRDRRRMGAGGDLRGRGMARGPAQDGRGILAHRLLHRLFSGGGAELHDRRALRVARDVPDRRGAGRGRDPDLDASAGNREVAGGRGGRDGSREPVARNPRSALPAPHLGGCRAGDDRDRGLVGGRRV